MKFAAFAGRERVHQNRPARSKLDNVLTRAVLNASPMPSTLPFLPERRSDVVAKASRVLGLVFCLLCGALGTATAADLKDVLAEYTVTSWTQKDGLPPSAISSIAQD